MKKSILKNYEVKLLIVVENLDGTCNSGIVSFDTYSENKYNAILDVSKYIDLSIIKGKRAFQVKYDDDFTWYDAIDYSIVRVVAVNQIDDSSLRLI